MKFMLSTSLIGCLLCNSAIAQNSAQFEAAISKTKLLADLAALQLIATTNHGNRAPDTSGFDASLDYVKSRVQHSKFTTFMHNYQTSVDVRDSASLKINGVKLNFQSAGVGQFDGPLNPAQRVTGPIVRIETGGPNFCNQPNWIPNVDIQGKILLYRLHSCWLQPGWPQSPDLAQAAGILFYQDNWKPDGFVKRDLSEFVKRQNAGPLFAIISKEDALKLHSRLDNQETLNADLRVKNFRYIDTNRQNLVVETVGGDNNNVIVLGAQLGSWIKSPGINTSSGVPLLLALIDAIKANKFTPKNKIRFIFWTDTTGASQYTSGLTPTEAARILLYLNFESVSRGVFGVYDGDGSTYNYAGPANSGIIESTFVNYFASKGITAQPAAFGINVLDFAAASIPVGGLFGGNSAIQDPCWQQSCDNLLRINTNTLQINAKAAAHALYTLDNLFPIV